MSSTVLNLSVASTLILLSSTFIEPVGTTLFCAPMRVAISAIETDWLFNLLLSTTILISDATLPEIETFDTPSISLKSSASTFVLWFNSSFEILSPETATKTPATSIISSSTLM